MGKLTDWAKEREAQEQKKIENNIIMNSSAMEKFKEQIENLDFYFKKSRDGFDLRVLLTESSIAFPKKENYPFEIYIEKAHNIEKTSDFNTEDLISVEMGKHKKSFNRSEFVELFYLYDYMEFNLPKEKTALEKLTEANERGPISW